MNGGRVSGDTWCAVLTPIREGAISVIEVGGPGAVAAMEGLFHRPGNQSIQSFPPGRLVLGALVDGEDRIDEVMATWWDGANPRVEIQCHGGAQSIRRITRSLERRGVVRLDEPQRLDRRRRAGEMDRIQAEAVEAIPSARSTLALTLLLSQARGALSGLVRDLEAGRAGADAVMALLEPPRLGEALCSPRRVAIVGPPNAGKSQLFNALVREERVITAEIPGTTRDAIAEEILIDGVPLVLVDTAGLRDTDHPVETQAIEVSEREVARADLALFVLDRSQPVGTRVLRDLWTVAQRVPRTIVVLNKADLEERATFPDLGGPGGGDSPVEVSALRETGLGTLEARMLDALVPRRNYTAGAPAVFTARQVTLFSQAMGCLTSRAEDAMTSLARVCGQLLGTC
jgi:tRNA modification GTPase